MFLCDVDWYKEVLNGFAGSHTNHDNYAVNIILSAIAPGKDPGPDDQKEVFANLAEYLSCLWRSKRYREMLEFLICARGTNLIDIDKLDDALYEIPHMRKVIKISRDYAEIAENKKKFDYSYKDWASVVYSSDVLGIDPEFYEFDIDDITNHDIDKIQEVAGEHSHYLFRPMLQYLTELEQYEQLWYMLNRYIIPSFCSKNCRTNNETARSLSLLLGELSGVLRKISYINGEIDLFYSKKDSLEKMLNASKDGDTETFDIAVKELFFKDIDNNELKLNDKLVESLTKLFYHAIKDNELISRKLSEYFCSLLLGVMVFVGMYNEASSFIYNNKDYIHFTGLDKMLLIVSIALRTDNFDILNMIYGIFLTEKTSIDNLRITITSFIKKCVDYLTGVYNRCIHDNDDSYYHGMMARYEESDVDEKWQNIREQYNKKTIDIFRDKFFVQCGILDLCEKAKNISDLSDTELTFLANKFSEAVKCICKNGSLTATDTGERIFFISGTIDINATKDEEHYIETYFFDSQDIGRGTEILNNSVINHTGFNNFKYRSTYNLMYYALLEKQTRLYLENMSGILENVLSERPEKYKIYLAEKWDEHQAEKLFIESFKNDEILDYIPGNLRNCFLKPRYYDARVEHCKRELLKHLDDSYKKAGDMYEQVFCHPETRRLLITAEWLWHNEYKSYENPASEYHGHEFTYLIANYLKAIELYIVFRLNEYVNKTGRIIEIEQVNRQLGKIHVGSPNWEEKVAIGNLYYCIKDNPELLNDTLKIKIRDFMNAHGGNTFSIHPVFNYLRYFADEIRNGYFHKDTILDFPKAAELRAKTLFVLKRIVADLKYI